MSGRGDSHGVSRVVQHKDYYLRSGDITFLVENHLYRVHSYFFERESLFFRTKFNANTNANGGDEPPGSTDNNAFTLEDTKSEDFARFLWVFYNPKYSFNDAPLETWLSILKLANRWTFDSVKELTVRELEKIEIEPIEKIAIYHDHNISRLYLVPSYISVCKRDKSLSFTEGMKLGMETVLRIAEARERLRLQASESGIRTPTFEDFEDAEVESLVREIFNLGSRPTSPTPATSQPSGVHGGMNGTSVKLNPAPLGHPSRANGGPGPRANGGSAADPKASSVDGMPSIAAVFSRGQELKTPTATPLTTTQTTTQQTAAPREPRPPQPPVKPTEPVSHSPPAVPPQAADKDKDKEKDPEPGPKSGGVGEPSSPEPASQVSSHEDVLNSKPVVPSSEQSDNVHAKSKDNVNDADKDEPGKENDGASAMSDTDGFKQQGPKSKRGGKNTRGKKQP